MSKMASTRRACLNHTTKMGPTWSSDIFKAPSDKHSNLHDELSANMESNAGLSGKQRSLWVQVNMLSACACANHFHGSHPSFETPNLCTET